MPQRALEASSSTLQEPRSRNFASVQVVCPAQGGRVSEKLLRPPHIPSISPPQPQFLSWGCRHAGSCPGSRAAGVGWPPPSPGQASWGAAGRLFTWWCGGGGGDDPASFEGNCFWTLRGQAFRGGGLGAEPGPYLVWQPVPVTANRGALSPITALYSVTPGGVLPSVLLWVLLALWAGQNQLSFCGDSGHTAVPVRGLLPQCSHFGGPQDRWGVSTSAGPII